MHEQRHDLFHFPLGFRMSWYGKPMRNLDGRTGRIIHASEGFGHLALQIQTAENPLYKEESIEKVWVQLNSFGPDTGEIGWFWWSADFGGGEGGWLLLGDHNPVSMKSAEVGKMPPFTADNLEAVAAQAKVTYERLLSQFPPGTLHGARNLAHTRMKKAEVCAKWLRAKGIASITHVGPWGDLPKSGQKARLPVGTVVTSWGGSQPNSQEVLTRRQTVTIAHVNAGGADDRDPDMGELGVRQASIQWSGTGQRFRSAEVAGLEFVE